MSKLVEATHVTLGGEIGAPDAWARPYLDDEHTRYADKLLTLADALLQGRLRMRPTPEWRRKPLPGHRASSSTG